MSNPRSVVLSIGVLPHCALITENYSVIQTTSATTGVSIARSEHPDVIVVDITVPGAWIACRLLRSAEGPERGAPLVLLAPRTEPAAYVRARQVGALTILIPEQPENLLTVLDTLMRGRTRQLDYEAGWE
jgi:DNA-binding response OmpR family regulator